MKMKIKKQLVELLNIYGVSKQEHKVREYLYPKLERLVDTVTIDSYGNLLGVKKVGNGDGAVVMLSAHMDTVYNVERDRKLIFTDDIIMSDKGALGADDRAGITIILSVLENIEDTGFNGTIKVAFSREEEIGCIGADKMNPEFYSDVDLAIVVDRRGNRDIVVNGAGMPFCTNDVKMFMNEVADSTHMKNWLCVMGGVSDAVVFAENGINSINVSAGYYNEHTDLEYVSVADMVDSISLIKQTLSMINDYYHEFSELDIFYVDFDSEFDDVHDVYFDSYLY